MPFGAILAGGMIAPVASVSAPAGFGSLFSTSSSTTSLTYSTFWRQGVYRLSVRNGIGQFVLCTTY